MIEPKIKYACPCNWIMEVQMHFQSVRDEINAKVNPTGLGEFFLRGRSMECQRCGRVWDFILIAKATPVPPSAPE